MTRSNARNQRSRQRALQPLADVHLPAALAARDQISEAVDTLLSSFVGEVAIRSAQNGLLGVTEGELPEHYNRLREAARAITLWHADEAYLTPHGDPRPLRENGAVSLASLAKRVASSTRTSKQIVRDLVDLGIVVKTPGGFHKPAIRSAVVNGPSALILAHATAAILRLVGTVSHNISGKHPRRFERHVDEVRIRSSDLPVFLRFVEEQGQYLIDSVDDWLSRREIKGRQQAGEVTVGIGAFAWADPPKLSRRRGAKSRARANPLPK